MPVRIFLPPLTPIVRATPLDTTSSSTNRSIFTPSRTRMTNQTWTARQPHLQWVDASVSKRPAVSVVRRCGALVTVFYQCVVRRIYSKRTTLLETDDASLTVNLLQ